MRSRTAAFAALATVCVVALLAVAGVTVLGARQDRAASERAVAAARPRAQDILAGGGAFAVVRSVDRSRPSVYGRIEVAPLNGATPGPAALAGPACRRVAFAAGRGLCLDVLGTETDVQVLDARMRTVHDLELPGIPSRARISPDGRWGGVTAFIVGHAYAAPGQFSTAASIIDLRSGRKVADLEKDVRVTNGGKLVDARDRNYWGLTFARDGDTFYATLATGGRTFLVEGSIRDRTAHVIHENVECPALSPDGTRIGYKKAIAHDPTRWRFHVLDLATGRETPLAETRSIDDQLSWLDDRQLLYSDGERTYVVDADGSGRPRPWMAGADSPTVEASARS
jgi:hypothetical protein